MKEALQIMINIKRILCPTDLSPYSGNAVRYALALARAHDAELILLYCTDDLDGKELLLESVLEHIDPSDSRCRFVIAPADPAGLQSRHRSPVGRASR